MLATSVAGVHEGFGWFVVVGNGMVGAWALAAHRWLSLRGRPLWAAVGVAHTAVIAQAVIGAALVGRLDGDPPRFHLFYGFVAVITVGLIVSYRQQLPGREHLLFGLGGLFLTGLAIRAMVIDTVLGALP